MLGTVRLHAGELRTVRQPQLSPSMQAVSPLPASPARPEHTPRGTPARGLAALVERPTYVRVLDVDPDLGCELDAADRRAAAPRTVAQVQPLSRGEAVWESSDGNGQLGLLVLQGVLAADVGVAGRRSCELYGSGDLLRPWSDDRSGPIAPPSRVPIALEPALLAVLDRHFAERIAPWPALTGALARRTVQRSTWLSLQLMACHRRRVDARLLMLFSIFAERWGRVGLEGIHLPVRLTHGMLGTLVGAQRPSVTAALATLREGGMVSRRRDGSWMLHAQPDELPLIIERGLAPAAGGAAGARRRAAD